MSASKPTDLPFEQAMERLEEIVASMEGERMPLDQMVSIYEEGSLLLNNCRQRIENARQRIESVSFKPDGRLGLNSYEIGSEEGADEKNRTGTSPRRRQSPAKTELTDEDNEIRLF